MPKKGTQIPPPAAIKILATDDVKLDWRATKPRKESAYLKMLIELAGDSKKIAQVESQTARGAIQAQAKKNAIKVIFAERGTLLFCKVLGKFTPEELVLSTIKNDGPQTFAELIHVLEKYGFKDEHPKGLMQSLSGSQLVMLLNDKTKGDAWKLTPKGVEYCTEKRYE